MNRHYTGIGLALLIMIVAFVIALALGSKLIAFGALIVGLVMMFVMGVAYMRPRGHTPEHHAEVDRIVNDTNP